MPTLQQMNPFAKRESHTTASITTYKVLTTVTWLLSLITSVYYAIHQPIHRDGYHIAIRIWDQNYLYRTAFTMSSVIGNIYWIVMFVLQAGYIGHLFSKNTTTVNAAASVGGHFILNNLFHFAFVMLFVRGHFIWAELIIILNFMNLSALYFRHNTYPRFIHMPVISGPLAWTFVAIYWNGALMIKHPSHLVPRIFGNIFIWSILVYGAFFIVAYRDYTMGFCLSTLAAAIGVAQFLNKTIALQWIFAFVIMAVLFIATVVVALPTVQNKKQNNGTGPVGDQERAPLLGDN